MRLTPVEKYWNFIGKRLPESDAARARADFELERPLAETTTPGLRVTSIAESDERQHPSSTH
jgi:hypothetical protein